MGGQDSGRRWHYSAKDTTSDMRSIDIRKWHRECLICSYSAFIVSWARSSEPTGSIGVRAQCDRVELTYRHKDSEGDWQDINYPVLLGWTDCNYGGQRPWFICPASSSNNRVAILYGGKTFACRECYQLAYESQRTSPGGRAPLKADRIRDKMDWEPGVLNGTGGKPKGMHWKTFNRMLSQHDHFVDRFLYDLYTHLKMPP